MEDRKNIVIKVKYPTSGKNSVDATKPKVVEQWDVKRIAIAAGGLLAFIMLLVLVFSGDDEQATTVSQTVVSEKSVADMDETRALEKPLSKFEEKSVVNATDKPVLKAIEPTAKTIETSKTVLRSLLTFNIKDSEPQAAVTSPLHLSKTKPVSVFYFAELNNMKGKTVYLEWLLEGDLITRKKVNISGDNWRMTSRQYLNDNIKTHWIVRIVDHRSHLITQIPFETIYE